MEANDVLPAQADSLLSSTVGLAIAGACLLVFALAWCRIFSKAGYHGALGLLMLVPVANVVMFLVLAFGGWPAAKELRSLRKVHKDVQKAEQRHFARAA